MKRRSKTANFAVAGFIGVLVLIAFFLPELVGFGWHVIHGPDAVYHGWRIPVPTGWFAMRRGEGLVLERMLHLPIRDSTPTVVLLPMHTGTGFVFDPNVWADVQIGIQARRGYRLAGMRQIIMAGHTGYCWEFVRRKDQNLWWITCLAPSQRLSADFSGRHPYSGAFYEILPGITPDRNSG